MNMVEIERALRRRVWLPRGGHINIDHTEALTAIDVDTVIVPVGIDAMRNLEIPEDIGIVIAGWPGFSGVGHGAWDAVELEGHAHRLWATDHLA